MAGLEALAAAMAARAGRLGDRPFVTLTYAQSLDGSIAARPGKPLALSGHDSLMLTHRLRAAHDAILVGIGTVLADNPQLTVRLAPGEHPQPVVLDTHLRCPANAALLRHPAHRPWLLCGPNPEPARRAALTAAGAQVCPLPLGPDGRVDLGAALSFLAASGIRALMVEGGAQVITAFLARRCADFVVLTLAPVFIGGVRAVEGLLAPDVGSLPRLRNVGYQQAGEDLILWGGLS